MIPSLILRLCRIKRSIGTKKYTHKLDLESIGVRFRGDYYYSGYWQELELPYSIYKTISTHLASNINLSLTGDTTMHLRLGDYQSNKNSKIYYQLDCNYYRAAINKLNGKFQDNEIMVITNDVTRAKDYVVGSLQKTYKFNLTSGNYIDDFEKISSSKNLIVSNSTFCWWATLVGCEAGFIKRIVSSSHWFNSQYTHRQHPAYSSIPNISNNPIEFCSI